jgi:Uncharacterised nucleotidyltransferase
MKEDEIITLIQSGIIGNFEIIISNEELAILKLLSTKSENILSYWREVWQSIDDYEELSFASKELMASAVKKIQEKVAENKWKEVTKGNAEFLSGLPRYTWTKNQYILNQYRLIANALQKEKIEFIAIKGVGEMIANNHLSLMRTSRDIDILIKIEDWDKCLPIFEKIGWVLPPKLKRIDFSVSNDPAYHHEITLYNNDRIIDLDVHFAAIAGPRSYSNSFTLDLWENRVPSPKYPDLFIPGVDHRFVIFLVNAYNFHNWNSGQYCKYLLDALLTLEDMGPAAIEKTITTAEQHLKMGERMRQLLSMLERIKCVEQSIVYSKPAYFFRFSLSSSFARYLLILSYLRNWINTSYTLSQKKNIILYILFRFFRELFIKIPIHVLGLLNLDKRKNSMVLSNKNKFYWYL